MKYILFMATQFYPSGGMDDLMGQYDSLQAAQDIVNEFAKSLEGHYPGVNELNAQVAVVTEDGIAMIQRFRKGVWIDDGNTLTIESQAYKETYLAQDLRGYLGISEYASWGHGAYERLVDLIKGLTPKRLKELQDNLKDQ